MFTDDYRERFKNKFHYPNRDDYKRVFIYKGGECIYEAPYNTYITSEWRHKKTLREIIIDEEAYKAERKIYNNEDARIYNEFRAEVLEENGLTNHPKADKVMSMAWEDGHSSGYEEVANYVEKYADLVRD